MTKDDYHKTKRRSLGRRRLKDATIKTLDAPKQGSVIYFDDVLPGFG